MRGICKLCLQTRELRHSHLLPKALYRMSRWKGEKNPNPLLLSAEGAVQTSLQVKDYVLCSECEQRFNREGERYAMSQVQRGGKFPLLAALSAVSPSKASGGFAWYHRSVTPGIDREKLAYFALSVFWRASVHVWHNPEKMDPPIRLGSFEEPIRKYLLGETGFPDEIVLMLFVCTDSFSQNVFYEPNRGNDLDPTTWTFEARGLNFFLSGKSGKPPRFWEACLVKGPNQMIVARDCHDKVAGAVNQLIEAARVRRN